MILGLMVLNCAIELYIVSCEIILRPMIDIAQYDIILGPAKGYCVL